MRSTKLGKTFGGFILGIALLLGIGIMSSTTAQAQYRNQDEYRREQDRYRREQEQYRREQEQYRRDQDQYRRDRDDQDQYGRDRNQNRRDDWWNRNRRRGRDSDGYGNYGGSFDLRQTALNAGFAEGAKAGRKDRRNGDRYDFRDESVYQKASKDYSSRLGDRYIYQRYFREAFEHGYADGYAGY